MDLMGMPQQPQQQQQGDGEVVSSASGNNVQSGNPDSVGPAPSQQQQGGSETMSEQTQIPLSQMLAAAMNSAAANTTTKSTSTYVATPAWRLELMMEKLRQKRAVLKPLQETAKNLRQALMERRCFLDPSDKLHLQKCLDTLQQSIKVNSLSSMVERLDMVSRQLGLKLSPGANEQEWFISSDMFYLEVLIDSKGVVRDMKIQHEGKTEQLQCPDLIKSLEIQDFKDFSAHLQGLISIYNLNADKHIKSKAFIALQAMESDLAAIASTYTQEAKADQVIMKHLLGHFQPRRGGHPVKLTFYISPYEFFDKETKTCIPNDINEIVKRQLGTSATVSIQGSPGINRKLQMSNNVTVYRNPEGKSMPRYGTLNATNSTALPACFVLKLAKPIPIFKGLLNSIQTITGIENSVSSEPQPILSLITKVVSDNQLDCSEEKGLFVTLPDQHHCYFMTETSGLEGVLVSSISFTLASQLPQLIVILRQQLMFNTLVGSCIRLCSKPENGSIVFELSALSHHNLSVSFQHPLDDSLVTLEFDIRDVMIPSCRVHALYSTAPDMIPTLEEHACTVVRRSMSIPVTVRAVIRRWQSMKVKSDIPKPDSLIPAPSTSSNGAINPLLPVTAPSCGLESQQIQQPSFKQCMNYNAPAQTTPIDVFSYMNNPIFASLHQNIQSTKNGQGQFGAGVGALAGSSVLQGLLDHNNPAKRRKRNKTSTEIQKSPVRQKSPIRPDDHQGGTPGWISDLGLEQECRWNIDITPVGNSGNASEDLKRKYPVKRSVSLDSNMESDDRMPSLSITPVNASAGASSTVNSLLASIRPGIEIIPLPNPQNPPNIPNSITVTPILPNSTDLKKIKKRPEDLIEKKKIKRVDVKHVNKLQQQGGKPSVTTMKSVSSLPKPKKLAKPSLDITKKTDPKLEKDKSLVIYQPPKTQAATQAVAAALAAANKTAVTKKGSLDSVINKLKLQSASAAAVGDGDNTVKKSEQLSTKDLLKASSSITDIIQKNQSKSLNEYSVKSSSGLVPGGGLKLTINKSLTAAKFDVRKKGVIKRPLGQNKPKPLSTGLKDEPKRPLLKKEEMNKITDTRKLYMPSLEPGSLFKDTPRFDLKNFQIPKKSKPVEKVETPPAPPTPPISLVEKAAPELTVEPINPPLPSLTPTPPPTQAPPRQPTPQPAAPAPTPVPPVVSTPALPPLIPVGPPPPVSTSLTAPSIPTTVPEVVASSKPPEDPKPSVEPAPAETPAPPTLPPPPQLLPLVMPPKETIISPESPEPMDTSESIVTPQNIPTTPPTTVDEPPEKPVEPEPVAVPPRSTTPAPPPRSVTPAPPRSTTPAPVTAPTNNVAPPQPATQPPPSSSTTEKASPVTEEPPAVPPPPPPVSESSPVVSMNFIVKSPAPNSPAAMLLRSPLIVQSPHTPFTIDDDLMDEALIGGAPSNPEKTT